MDQPVFKTLRICPTTQQGGTQTIQQAIYLTHKNPCGANLLIFQEMGLTQIRYIDLKNYVDEILGSEEMKTLFEQIRIAATEYIDNPTDLQKFYKYLYAIMNWAEKGISNLSVPINYYPGYRFRVNVYDASGTLLYDSFYPSLKIVFIDSTDNLFYKTEVPILGSNPYYWIDATSLYKISSAPAQLPFIEVFDMIGYYTVLSNFVLNQSGTAETVMAIASLLVDSANTRTFGIPRYGFSARSNLSSFAGIAYNCAHFIDIRTTPGEDGKTTLVESIFFRLSLEEDTYYLGEEFITNENYEEKLLTYLCLVHDNKMDIISKRLQMLTINDQDRYEHLMCMLNNRFDNEK